MATTSRSIQRSALITAANVSLAATKKVEKLSAETEVKAQVIADEVKVAPVKEKAAPKKVEAPKTEIKAEAKVEPKVEAVKVEPKTEPKKEEVKVEVKEEVKEEAKPVEEKTFDVVFEVTLTASQARALKDFFNANGIPFRKVER